MSTASWTLSRWCDDTWLSDHCEQRMNSCLALFQIHQKGPQIWHILWGFEEKNTTFYKLLEEHACGAQCGIPLRVQGQGWCADCQCKAWVESMVLMGTYLRLNLHVIHGHSVWIKAANKLQQSWRGWWLETFSTSLSWRRRRARPCLQKNAFSCTAILKTQ